MPKSNSLMLDMEKQPAPQIITRADKAKIVAKRLASARLLLLGTNKFIIGFSLFLKACESFADLGKGLVGLVMAFNKFDCNAFKGFERVLH